MLIFALVVAALCAAYVFLVVRTVRRIRRLGGGFIVQYLPIKGMPLSDAAILTRRDKNVAAATLIDLTVRKKIRILAPPTPREPVSVEFLNGSELHPDEAAIMEALFGRPGFGQPVRRFTRENRQLARALREVLRTGQSRLTRLGFVRRGGSALRPLLVALGWGGLLLGGLGLLGALVALQPVAIVLFLLTTVACIVTLTQIPPTWRVFRESAAPYRDHLNGLYDYITLAEADRFRVLQSPQGALQVPVESGIPNSGHPVTTYLLNERLLPYAVLFGHGKEWLDKLRVDAAVVEQYSGLDLSGTGLGDLAEATALITNLAHIFDSLELADFGDLAGSIGDVVGEVDGGVLGGVFDGFGLDL
ncbi:hypothetical protein GCM10022198_13140 [Klugiella xanthotipulae]|uniref:Putative membrane protein DUF2207 n=1 Tax=Klugiella xanthotipulae TaxID=244735 RepID=A0A543I478_9MICO|nr:DUF2207 domain-containing protein [Klugiella xanthotipulae]TQM65399.1 putative membrane protein DUF2207 [Klugiella xanthotipulae]